MSTPPAELDIDLQLVTELLANQFPDLARLSLRECASGWDNVIFRLGEQLTVRLPRRQPAAKLIENEQRWLPHLAPRLSLAIPAPVRCGKPDLARGYPWAWSVCPWFPGESAFVAPPADVGVAARTLGIFLRELHQAAPPDAPKNPYRGVPLAGRAETFFRGLESLELSERRRAAALWHDLVKTPAWSLPPVWIHGDLHLFNLVVFEGRLAAVIDFGDLTAGDPATDFAVAWMLFGPKERELFCEAVQTDAATWRRARAWALAFAVVYLAPGESGDVDAAVSNQPVPLQRLGRKLLDAVLAPSES